jgi:hypothetical protein
VGITEGDTVSPKSVTAVLVVRGQIIYSTILQLSQDTMGSGETGWQAMRRSAHTIYFCTSSWDKVAKMRIASSLEPEPNEFLHSTSLFSLDERNGAW